SHFFFEHAGRRGYQTGAQRVAAHQLAEVARGMGLGHSVGPHLVEVGTHASARKLVSRFCACESAAHYADDFFHDLLGDLDGIAALFLAATARAPTALGDLRRKIWIVSVRAGSCRRASLQSKLPFRIALPPVKDFAPPRLALFQIA